jgi:hypothetical protein
MKKNLKRALGVVALLLDLLNGCVIDVVNQGDDWEHSGNAEASAAFSRTLALGEQTVLRVVGANGSVKVWGVPGAQGVVVDAVRRVRSDSHQDAEAHLVDLQVLAQAWPHEIEVKTAQPQGSNGRSYIVDYEITVPAHLATKVANGNGSIRIENMNADVEVVNGNGEVTLEDLTGSSRVSVGNGTVSAWTHLPLGGQVVYAVGNGAIFLSVQPQVSAHFSAKVGNGTIHVTGLDLQNVLSSPRQLQGVLGSGRGLIDLSTGNGEIRVQGGQ